MTNNTSFNQIAQSYNTQMGNDGDFTHKHSIDPKLYEMIGDLNGKIIYDIGSGNGYLDKNLIKAGAGKIYASDISSDLIHLALSNDFDNINFFVASGENFIANQPPT